MNNKIEKHEEICNAIHEMYIKKNADYGDSVGELYNKLGDISFLTRISDKYNRLMNLMIAGGGQNYESIEDTIQDLANYCIIWLLERELLYGKREEEEEYEIIDTEEDEICITHSDMYDRLKNTWEFDAMSSSTDSNFEINQELRALNEKFGLYSKNKDNE